MTSHEVEVIAFPRQALLILQERLKEHQAQGLLSADADVTAPALRILVLVERVTGNLTMGEPSSCRRRTSGR